MKSVAAMLTVLGLLPAGGNAAEPAPLDEEFLEYLAEFETGSDDWTWFATQEPEDGKDASKRATQPAAQRQEKIKP